MKTYTGKYRVSEQLERCGRLKGKSYHTGTSKRNANKCFRQTARNLIQYDLESIYTPNYKQRHGWEL